MTQVANHSGLRHAWFKKSGPGGALHDVLAVRGTFDFAGEGEIVTLSRQQEPIMDGDEFDGPVDEHPLKATLKRVGDRVLYKPRTDIHVVGAAKSKHGALLREWLAGVQVGSVRKLVRLRGPHRFERFMGRWRQTPHTATDTVPLDYRLAFGGTFDLSELDPCAVKSGAATPLYKADNPVGCGWLPSDKQLGALPKPERRQYKALLGKLKALDAPQIEDPSHPVNNPFQTLPSQGLGPVARWWEPRVTYQGTLDQAWLEQRYPAWPDDFDPRFYQSAHADLIAPGHLIGDEPVGLMGLLPEGILRQRLPGLAPLVVVTHVSGHMAVITPVFDTLTIDLDARQMTLVWRATFDRVDPVDTLTLGATQIAGLNDSPAMRPGVVA